MDIHLTEPLTYAGVPLEAAATAAILVHGRGQQPDFMLELVDRLALPGVAYVLPRATGSTWYPARFMEATDANEPHLSLALEQCTRTVDHVLGQGIPLERLFLVGFSQGACLLSEFLVRTPRRYAGAALHTGGFVGPEGARSAEGGTLAGLPVFMGISRRDEWVPLDRAEETAELLTTMGAQVTLEVYDDQEHHINDAAVARTRALLMTALR